MQHCNIGHGSFCRLIGKFISAFSLSSFHWREVAEVGEAVRKTAAAALVLRGGGTDCKQQVGGSIILQEGVSSACPRRGGKRDRGVDGFAVASLSLPLMLKDSL